VLRGLNSSCPTQAECRNSSVLQPHQHYCGVRRHNFKKFKLVAPFTWQGTQPIISTKALGFVQPHLFNFDDISSYIIPQSALYGRLVICATRKHRIIGFPVELRGNYKRVYFRYNLCFVFERTADLSCYEPIVRKVSRVLTACEVRSLFLLRLSNISDIF